MLTEARPIKAFRKLAVEWGSSWGMDLQKYSSSIGGNNDLSKCIPL